MPTLSRCLVALLALAILAIVAGAVSSARAEVRVTGVPAAVLLEANDATLDEALTALGALGLRYRSAVVLNQRITGTYQGPLARIISRLLQGYNFVIRTSSEGVEATVLEDSSATAVPGPQTFGAGRFPPPVPEDPTIAGLKRVMPKAPQNPAGPRRRPPDAAR